jgi:hypothetical protein
MNVLAGQEVSCVQCVMNVLTGQEVSGMRLAMGCC